jgi:hypothetical protein
VSRAAFLAAAALAVAGCASSRLPAETPDGAALDVGLSVRDAAAQVAGAVNGQATPARIQQLLGDAAAAQSDARRLVPSTATAKGPLLAAAGATAGAAHALTLSGGEAVARTQLARAEQALAQVADAVQPRVTDREGAVARLRAPLG